MKCDRVRGLFGAYWDDEITQAEREWMDAHFASCAACKSEYEGYARTLELVSSLPRIEAAPDLVDRVVARAKRAAATADELPSPRVAWVPVAAVSALALLAAAVLGPWMTAGPIARHAAATTTPATAQLQQPVRVLPSHAGQATTRAGHVNTHAAGGEQVAVQVDSVFDHSEDVEFILDPVTVHRGRMRPVTPRVASVQGERAVITF
jgi:anti-sigma factor RsiW